MANSGIRAFERDLIGEGQARVQDGFTPHYRCEARKRRWSVPLSTRCEQTGSRSAFGGVVKLAESGRRPAESNYDVSKKDWVTGSIDAQWIV